MTSRLYITTRKLFGQVFARLKRLGVGSCMSALSLSLLALYICGLLLHEKNQNATRMALWLPARAHDAINRLLTQHRLSTRQLFGCLIEWAKRLGRGYLVIDEVVVEKPFAQKCAWVGYIYSTSRKRTVKGMCAIVLLFCVGPWRIPIAFRLWRPKQHTHPKDYKKRTQLAWEMLQEIAQSGLSIQYVTFDNFYAAGWLTKNIEKLGWIWVSMLESKTHVQYRHQLWQAGQLAATLKLKWRSMFDLRAGSIIAYLPKYGTLRLVVTKNGHGNYQVLASNALDSDLSCIIQRKLSRWSVETLFRDTKQFCGLAACQCRVDVAQVRHFAFALLAFLVLQMLCQDPKETLGLTKDRLRQEAFLGQKARPPMLKGKVPQATLLTA